MKHLPTRKPNRLKNHDYSQNGAYFITICTKNHAELFGNIVNTPYDQTPLVGANLVRPLCVRPLCVRPQLSAIGNAVEHEINEIKNAYDNVTVDKYVIMPNHVHMIIKIQNDGIGGRTRFAPTISRIIKQTKGLVTKQIGFSPWQKSFHDHIIRNEQEYAKIAEYIENNPVNWQKDCFHPANTTTPVGANLVRPHIALI